MENYPEYFFIELTQNCNLYCTMCRPHKMINENWFMSDELLELSLSLAERYAKVADLRGWGESSLDSRLIPTALRLFKKGIEVRIYTNMCANDCAYWSRAAKTGMTPAISIETGIPSHYSALRRGGELDVMLQHLEAFLKHTIGQQPYFTTVISEDNIDDLDSLVKLASEYGIKEIELNPISKADKATPSGRRTGLRACDTEHAIECLTEMSEITSQCGVSVKVAANLFSEYSLPPRTCIHPWKYFCICYNGDVTFCDHLLHHKAAVMGNLLSQSFEEIWFGNDYEKLRCMHEAAVFDEMNLKGIECEWCCQNRYGNSEYLVKTGIAPIELDDYLKSIINRKG